MGYVLSHSPTGLVVASQGSDEQAASRALREYDRDLRLIPPGVLVQGEQVVRSDAYRVYKYVGSERPIQFVCGWWDAYGNPYPLSASGVLEMVRRLDPNTRGRIADSDTENARLVARRRADAEYELDELTREHRDRVDGRKLQPQPRSRNLWFARIRERRRIKHPDLKP